MRKIGFLGMTLLCILGVNIQAQDDIVAEFKRTSVPPVIDGLGDDAAWANANSYGIEDFFELGEASEGIEDMNIVWKGLYDDDNLYVFVQVTDDEIFNEETCNWEDDSIEIYIDAQNLDVEDYQFANAPDTPAYQFTVVAGDNPESYCGDLNFIDPDGTTVFTAGINSYAGDDESTTYPQGADTSKSVFIDDNTYTLEVAFPWDAIEATPESILNNQGGEFGFGVAINDNDIEGGRNTQFMWATEAGDLWMRSDTMPSVALVPGGGGTPGDFDNNGALEAADIDTLATAIRDNSADAQFDLNGDGSVNGDDHTTWVETLKNTWFGDANLDGEFNSSDFVAVFQAGKFENGQSATWGEGDWDGDGVFGSGDFVKAFQSGGFEIGPRAAAQSVPEPSAIVLFGLGIAMMVGRRR